MQIYDIPKIDKPIYETDDGSYVAIYDKYIKSAIRYRQYIRITTNWRGKEISGVYFPKQWKKGQKIEKVYKYPNLPMILYGGLVKAPKQKTDKQKLMELSLSRI